MSEMEARGVVLLTAWEDIGEEFWPSPTDQREYVNVCGWVWTATYKGQSSEMILADFPGYKQGEERAPITLADMVVFESLVFGSRALAELM
ncbi:MAG: hypothetical protein ACRC7D_20855 [Aeromonas popoffii]|uniref:hypothetical protein n=1 Tax=Aeromonas popoffii TaxID=70856 RepID=UPI003F334CA0